MFAYFGAIVATENKSITQSETSGIRDGKHHVYQPPLWQHLQNLRHRWGAEFLQRMRQLHLIRKEDWYELINAGIFATLLEWPSWNVISRNVRGLLRRTMLVCSPIIVFTGFEKREAAFNVRCIYIGCHPRCLKQLRFFWLAFSETSADWQL
jgi:hypothetical protein